MKMMKWALLGSAALAVSATVARADDLADLKAQIEALQARVTQLEAQPQAYQDSVLLPDVRARMSIEAGVAHGWRQWVGDAGDIISIDRFGASAPYKEIYQHYGLTVEHVIARALRLLRRGGEATGKEEPKSSWVVRHDGYVFGCGVYRPPN